MPIWPFRKRTEKRPNTVALCGDGDDVDILTIVEEKFGITIADEEAEATRTVGDLYDLIQRKISGKTGIDPVWALTEYIVRDISCSRAPIDRDTTFFAKDAKPREDG